MSLIPYYLLKVTKFLVTISQFESTEKNVFVYFFCPEIFQILGYFLCKITPLPPSKKSPSFFTNTPLKYVVVLSPPFWKFGRRFREGHTMKDVCFNNLFLCTATLWNSLPAECFLCLWSKRHILVLRFFKGAFMYAFHLFILLFLTTFCLAVAIKPCLE